MTVATVRRAVGCNNELRVGVLGDFAANEKRTPKRTPGPTRRGRKKTKYSERTICRTKHKENDEGFAFAHFPAKKGKENNGGLRFSSTLVKK